MGKYIEYVFLLKFVLVTFKWGGQQTECGLKGFGIVSLKIVALNLKICFNPNFWKPFAQSNNNVLESRIDDKGSKIALGAVQFMFETSNQEKFILSSLLDIFTTTS